MENVAGGELRRLTAFTTDPSGGNPAGVWVGPALPESAVMQGLAAEVGYSETAFLATPDAGPWPTRYFAPQSEVPFCGHATIAAGVVLGSTHGDGSYTLDTPAGEIEVRVGMEGATRFAELTSVEPEHEPATVSLVSEYLRLLGWAHSDLAPDLPPARAYAGAWHLVLAVTRRETLADLHYDYDEMRRLMERDGLTTLQLVHRETAFLFHARNPFPVGGVVEDPATGAAAAALGGYLRESGLVGPPFELTIRQGVDMGRPSTLEVHVPVAGGVAVRGPAVEIDPGR